MSEAIEKLQERIEVDKETLGLLPKNNLKNLTKSLEKIEEMKAKYTETHEEIVDEIKARYQEINKVEENPEIGNIEDEIQRIEDNITINNMKTSYERMELDRLIFSINGFYKKQLNAVNQDIYMALKKFESVGIVLTANDFDYSEYAHEYMKVFIEEAKKGNVYTDKIKDTFEKLYIKCSELIMHISLNFRSLYHRNEKNIDKFYAAKKAQTLSEMETTEEQITEKCEAMKARVNSLREKDDRIILNKFLSTELIINDYKKENISALINKMQTAGKNDDEEFYTNIRKLLNNLKEYQIYTEFKFLVNDIISMFKKNEKNKDNKEKSKKTQYDERMEEIAKAEKKLYQLNANISKSGKVLFFMKKKEASEAAKLERNNQILVLKDLYRKLDDDMIDRAVKTKISETTTILDTLIFATSFYNFIARKIIKQFPDITEDEINNMIIRLKEAIKQPNFSVINNMNITEVKDMSIIIKDKYKLLGLNVNKEDFEESSVDSLVAVVKTLTVFNNIKNSNLTLEEIEFMCKAKEILKGRG